MDPTVRLSAAFLTVYAALAMAVPSAAAQTSTSDAAVRGVVLDLTKAPIAGASVGVSSEGQHPPVSATTDQTGSFMLPVPPGRYAVRISSTGFSPLQQDVIAAPASQRPTEFVLTVEGVRETVTVAATTGYQVPVIRSATRTSTPLVDVPQSVTVVTSALIKDQMMTSLGDVMRYVPGISVHQGENNRDQIIVRGNSSSADFFVDGVRDDVQYYRDLYNLDRVEAL
jgi:outer membrane receptor protein involved in Fe transport